MANTWVDNFRVGDVVSLGEFFEANTLPEYFALPLGEYIKEVMGIDFPDGHAQILSRRNTSYVAEGHVPYIGFDVLITGEHDNGEEVLPRRSEIVTLAWPANERATLVSRPTITE